MFNESDRYFGHHIIRVAMSVLCSTVQHNLSTVADNNAPSVQHTSTLSSLWASQIVPHSTWLSPQLCLLCGIFGISMLRWLYRNLWFREFSEHPFEYPWYVYRTHLNDVPTYRSQPQKRMLWDRVMWLICSTCSSSCSICSSIDSVVYKFCYS